MLIEILPITCALSKVKEYIVTIVLQTSDTLNGLDVTRMSDWRGERGGNGPWNGLVLLMCSKMDGIGGETTDCSVRS